MSNSESGRQRWTEGRRVKVANLYDEWLKEEKEEREAHQQQGQAPRRQSTPLRPGDTAGTQNTRPTGTIRAVTPDAGMMADDSIFVPERGTTSFERAFLLGTTTTIVGGPAATTTSATSPTAAAARQPRRLVKEREWEREGVWSAKQSSPPAGRNGARSGGMMGRNDSSRSNGQHAHASGATRDTAQSAVRPRTRTFDEARRRDRSPTSLLKSRNRIGSVHVPSSPTYQGGAEYLASVPVQTSPPSAPSIASLSSAVESPVDMVGRRSVSPLSSDTTNSLPTTLLPSNARSIVRLMRTLGGRMSGDLLFRRGNNIPWSQSYCYVNEDTGSLMSEPRGGEGVHNVLIPDLRGCSVIPGVEDETPHLEVNLPDSEDEVHLRLPTKSDFYSWFAIFLWWQSSRNSQSNETQPPSSPSSHNAMSTTAPDPPPRNSSARQRDRAGSSKSDRRKSVVNSLREAPVIKIGKMIYWDTNVGYSSNVVTMPSVGHPTTTRPPAYRAQSHGTRRWRRISGQLRENGELKLHSDADNSLISVVQLSQLSRCAIQRLDPSVLENDFCIAIYPQYTSSLSNSQPGFIRPIFLSLESRVLFEVWFVLLRAFTMPQLYGPPRRVQNGDADSSDSEHAHITTTTDMFRVERSLSIRMVEAKMFPPPGTPTSPDSGFSGGHSRGAQPFVRPEQHGYFAEVLLDNETRGRTAVKFEGLSPLWGESFHFVDLPPVLNSANVVVKRRPPDSVHAREQQESKLIHEAYGFTSDQHGGFTGLSFDVACGKVEIYLSELEDEKEIEKWWPIVNMYNQRVGEVLIKARAEEGVVLMAHDYQPLGELLHRFSNGLTLQISQIVPGELKRLSDCLLNIYQVSGKAGDWIQALVEEEIDGIHKDTPISRLRYSRRIGSNDTHESLGSIQNSERELIVRDMNKNATLEANLLFRGNTLLTKSLDGHMRRVGKEYLERSLASKIREINEKDPDCEVDPNRVTSQQDVERNWRRLLLFTQEIWKAIVTAKDKCPVELRMIFRHIRACAEDRYGDFLRSVSYSSVSGFLFLRFFCPAVLNPKLFGLLKDDIKPRARRTFTLIAKSLQTLANMASFGTKEQWMEPMNSFLTSHRESFKTFIDDICYVPQPISTGQFSPSAGSSPTFPPGVVSAETHLSYTTPMTIMQRLPPTSREGFPSLPYLIDQARAFADLVQLWMEITSPSLHTDSATASKTHSEIISAIQASEGDMVTFHETCTRLNQRTQECLSRAERAERPTSALSFHWEELIDQLQSSRVTGNGNGSAPDGSSLDPIADRIASDPSILPPGMDSNRTSDLTAGRERQWDVVTDEEDDEYNPVSSSYYDQPQQHPPMSSASNDLTDFNGPSIPSSHAAVRQTIRERPGSANLSNNFQGRRSLRRALQSRDSDRSPSLSAASASASNVSSAVSSDTEHTTGTTALPSYEREVRHRERREAARQQIQQQVEEAKLREREQKDHRRRGVVKAPLSALRKRREREGGGSGGGAVRRGVDMSHV